MQWNLRVLFFVSCIMAGFTVLSSLLLLWAALASYHDNSFFHKLGLQPIGYGKISMLIYLNIGVGGFLTLFSARTGNKPFWATRPNKVLAIGAAGSLAVTTLIACVWGKGTLDGRPVQGLSLEGYGVWPVWVWLYAIIVFLLQDAGKVRILIFLTVLCLRCTSGRHTLWNGHAGGSRCTL